MTRSSASITGTKRQARGCCSRPSICFTAAAKSNRKWSSSSALIRTPETLLHEAVLSQQGIQGLKPGADQIRRGQQPQRVPRGRGIHHDEVVGLGFRPSGDGQQSHEFIQAGQGKVQEAANILLIQEGAPGGDLGKLAPVPGLEGIQGILGVKFQDL